ncbi:hypothetical protein [Corallococcus caeni]|uniref:Uncharacterized protein n=1 Tax=Corallococcus caeni TaxID=3082388 RepID=A0ABQ6QVH1_9BACT|nr:hypothetical protein ASNO1_39340 [Corallococcus sp. NO1]
MKVSVQLQTDDIGDPVRARFAMARPIIRGMLFSTKQTMVEALGGNEKITLEQLARIYKEGSGDYGICFEYAVHDAIRRRDPIVHSLISTVLEDFCNITSGAESILFGAEKSGATHIIQTSANLLTPDSRILVGKAGQPPKLKAHLNKLVRAFRSPKHRETLPQSIRGLWKADLFIGSPERDHWVATTLKINRNQLVGDSGLRIGIYPETVPGESPRKDPSLNLILCPMPYNASFMELFSATFIVIKQLFAANAGIPSPVALPYSADRYVAEQLSARRMYPVVQILEAMEPLAQPGLLVEEERIEADGAPETSTVSVAPIPQTVSGIA